MIGQSLYGYNVGLGLMICVGCGVAIFKLCGCSVLFLLTAFIIVRIHANASVISNPLLKDTKIGVAILQDLMEAKSSLGDKVHRDAMLHSAFHDFFKTAGIVKIISLSEKQKEQLVSRIGQIDNKAVLNTIDIGELTYRHKHCKFSEQQRNQLNELMGRRLASLNPDFQEFDNELTSVFEQEDIDLLFVFNLAFYQEGLSLKHVKLHLGSLGPSLSHDSDRASAMYLERLAFTRVYGRIELVHASFEPFSWKKPFGEQPHNNITEWIGKNMKTGLTVLCESYDSKPLVMATKLDATEDALNVLENIPTMDSKDPYGNTALHYAVLNNNSALVEVLLHNGFSTESENFNGDSPLYLALQNKKECPAKLILDHGADANATRPSGVTVLHVASRNCSTMIVSLIIEKGADVNAVDKGGYSALSRAVFAQNWPVVDVLTASGADRKIKEPGGFQDLEFEWTEELRNQHIIWAIRADDEQKAIALVKQNCEIDVIDMYSWTPLHWAVNNGFKELTDLLLVSGLDPNSPTKGGFRPLHFAMMKKDWDVAKLLIAAGANPNEKNDHGTNAYRFLGGADRKRLKKLYKKHKK